MTTCRACFENGPHWDHGKQCRNYAAQIAFGAKIRRLAAGAGDEIPAPPDYSTPDAVTDRALEVGGWAATNRDSYGRPSSWARNTFYLGIVHQARKPGLYEGFSKAVAVAARKEGA